MTTLTSTQLSVGAHPATVESKHGYFHNLAAYGLIGIGIGFIGMLTLVFKVVSLSSITFSPPIIFTISSFTFAYLMLYTKWRWTPILAVVFALVEVLFNFERILNVMAAAAGGPDFYLTTIILAFIIATLLAGLLALLFNYYGKYEQVASLYAKRLVYMLAGFVLGVYFLYYLLPDSRAAIVGNTAGLPTLTMLNPEETIKLEAGKPVVMKVINESPFAIALHMDELGVHTVIPNGEHYITLHPAKPGRFKYIGTMNFHRKATPAQGLRTPGGKLVEGLVVVE